MLKIDFTKSDEKIIATIQNCVVTIQFSNGKNETETYADEETAVLVFENNVKALEASGYELNTECTGALKEVFSFLSFEDRYVLKTKNNLIERFLIFEADSISVWDGLYPRLKKAKPLGYFNPEKADPELFGIHCLRRFIAHPASENCSEFGLRLSMKIDNFLNILKKSTRANKLTHLELDILWRKGQPNVCPRDLSLEFPVIRRLSIPYPAFELYFNAEFKKLEWLILALIPNRRHTGETAVTDTLDRLHKYAPVLKIFKPTMHGEELALLATHPFIKRLKVLDLRNVNYCDYSDLLNLKPHLTHLEMIILNGYSTNIKIKKVFKNWKAIVFAKDEEHSLRLRKLKQQKWIFDGN
jgi:hypothetical protein